MGDRAAATILFHHVPPRDAATVLRFIADYCLNVEWGGQDVPDNKVLVGVMYTAEEISLSFPDDAASALEDTDVAYELYQDPKYEFDGVCDYVAPGLGRFSANADSDGQIHVTQHQLEELAVLMRLNLPSIRNDLFGAQWLEAFKEYDKATMRAGIFGSEVFPQEEEEDD